MTFALDPLNADSARQAFHAIRGYEYQVLAAALAWVDLDESGLIYLEVAEDYAQVIGPDIEAVQVKATQGSGAVTLNTPAIRDSMDSFVDLAARNPDHRVHLRFLTTSPIGLERSPDDRPNDLPGLEYWQLVRAGRADMGPLRAVLEGARGSEAVRAFCTVRTDAELRSDLVRRITWDCGRPETAALRRELEERVGLLLRREFSVPIQNASSVADVVASRVLERSAKPEAQHRVLTRPELHQVIDYATRLAVPRADFERLVAKLLAAPDTATPGQAIVSRRDGEFPSWIVDAGALPTPVAPISRERLEARGRDALNATGLCVLIGATGTGKSSLARSLATAYPDPCYWIDLRDTEPPEARDRLEHAFVLLADMGSATLMLEDLNCVAAPSVRISLGRLVGAARRRDMRIVITSYRRPSTTLLNGLGIDAGSVVLTPHFEQDETRTLVAALGGDPEVWGRVAHLAGGAGHPQLTHAFIAGMAARGWPVREIADMVARGFTNADLEDEQSAVRTNLIDSLPEPVRELLYRLSITTAPFERSLALAVGALEPRIERAGECFDVLAGRWLETPTADLYRASPLVRGLGRKMLTAVTLRQVHDRIATEMTSGSTIDAGNIDTVLLHGLAGASQHSLFKLTAAVNLADDETREAIAGHLTVFPALDTSKPIYPNDLQISAMLRLAQLRLAVAAPKPRGVDTVVQALLREADAVPWEPGSPDFRIAVLVSILNNFGIARHVPNWIDLLSRFRRLHADGDQEVLVGHLDGAPPTAVLFSIGIAGLDSVETLEAVFDDLSRLDDAERREFLTPIDTGVEDYHLVVHSPWTARSRQADFDAEHTIDSYLRMGALADPWGISALSVQCRVAVAMIADEHLGDTERALNVLGETATAFGDHPVPPRALAKLHRRAGNGAKALRHFRDAVSQQTLGPVDAVYTLREAAICAAECGDWNTAHTWFLRAQAASDPLDSIGLAAIGVGLLADAAVAAFRSGDVRGALELLRDALQSLGRFAPSSSLQSAHCHRLVRHTVLWLQAKVEGRDTEVAGEPIAMRPGTCSNPEPVPAIEQQPLGHIDFAWYMLAEIELANGLDIGVRGIVRQLSTQGHIPISEHALRTDVLAAAISAQNPAAFASHFADYLASATYCVANRDAIRRTMNILDPPRAEIPALPRNGPYDSVTERSAHHAILAYAVHSLLDGGHDVAGQLRDALTHELGDPYAGKQFLDDPGGANADSTELDGEVAALLRRCVTPHRPPPKLVFEAGLRLLIWIRHSPFNKTLIPLLKPWLKEHWGRILRTQAFLLYSPGATTPPIVDVLRSDLEAEQFAARLTLAAELAVHASLVPALRTQLQSLAEGAPA